MKRKIEIDPKVKALIFDIDGTIADTMPAHFVAFKNVLGKYGIEMTPKLFDDIAGIPVLPQMYMFKETLNPIGEFVPEVVAEEKEEEYFKSIETTKPIDVVYDVLKAYHGKLPIACGTGGGQKVATKTLEVIGAIDKIDALVTCDDVVNGKPAPDTFLKCAELLGVHPADCVVFEDGDRGIEAAIAAGMMVIDVREYID